MYKEVLHIISGSEEKKTNKENIFIAKLELRGINPDQLITTLNKF